MKHSGVCPGGGPAPPGPPSGGGGGDGEGVAGPIGLVLIFVYVTVCNLSTTNTFSISLFACYAMFRLLGALLAYFIIGAVIMKLKFQATGLDIVPNKTLWFSLPFLIKVCCSKKLISQIIENCFLPLSPYLAGRLPVHV